MAVTRIISFTPSTTDILKLLGLEAAIVGADSESCQRLFAPDVADLGPIDDIDVHQAEHLDAEVIIASDSVAGADARIDYLDPGEAKLITLHTERFDDLIADIYTIGVECGVEDRARRAVEQITERTKRIQALVTTSSEPIRAYFEWFPNPFVTVGNQSWISDMLKLSGAVNIFNDNYQPSLILDDDEEIIKRDPELVLLCWRGSGDDEDLDVDLILKRKGWQQLQAIKTKQVHFLPESLFAYPGPKLLDALEMLVDLVARAEAER